MTLTFMDFLIQLFSKPSFLTITILISGVILVNGWTDAPNAIATCVATRCLSPKKALIMAAIFDFLGIFIMTMINSTVAETIFNIVDFGDNSGLALTALAAALVAIVSWAVIAWAFGIPTSESHALIAGLTGSAIALQGNLSAVNGQEWMKVIYGLILSTVLGFGMGYIITKVIEKICKKIDRRKTTKFFKGTQILGGASMAFMHGAQDGQKFMGVFLLGTALANGYTDVTTFSIPIWLMALCSLLMTLGVSMGGYKIIKTVGMKMAKLEVYQGASADIASASSLFISSIFGIPVSTTHTKTTAIMGVGASKRISNVNWKVVKDMMLAWILTFPGCGLLGYLATFAFMWIF